MLRVSLICLPAIMFCQGAHAGNLLGVISYQVIPAEIKADADANVLETAKSQKRSSKSKKSQIRRIAEVDSLEAARLVAIK